MSAGAVMNMLRPRARQPFVAKSSPAARAPAERLEAGPVLTGSFDALDFDTEAASSQYYHIPPDPIGAAGPSHLVCVVNTTIQWYTKGGTLLGGKRLGMDATTAVGSFFETLSPLTQTFDPKVIYDQYEGRFLVVALEQTDISRGDPADTSRIFLAVSATSDPTGDWYFAQRDAKIFYTGAYRWADYPGIAVDDKAVYITANMFGFGSTPGYITSALWIFNKGVSGGLYAGLTATSATWINPHSAVGVPAAPMQPAHMFGTVPAGLGTFLSRYSGLSDGTDEYLSIMWVNNPLGSTTIGHAYVNCGAIDQYATALPGAPQPGTSSLISTNDRRTLNAVWRDGQLYISTTLLPPSGADAGQATAHWFNVSTSSLPTLSLTDQGDVGGEDIATGTHTFFPSVAVDASGDLGIGFSASASTIYPGAYFTGRVAGDQAGTNRGSGVLRAGVDFYVRTFGTGSNRWGDFSGSSIDPSDGSFWFFNEYAIARGTDFGGEDGRWGTAFGNLSPAALPVQIASFTGGYEEGRGVLLRWETVSEVNNFGFEIQKAQVPLLGYETLPNSFVPGHGTTNERHRYSFRDLNPAGGTWYYRLKQTDLDGSTHLTQGVRIEVSPVAMARLVPARTSLTQNYPNPFNPATTIRYGVPARSEVEMILFNTLGQKVLTLVKGEKDAGYHEVKFDASAYPTGVYFYRLRVRAAVGTEGDAAYVQTRKLVVTR
jgi:hypothetical protein